MESFQQRKLTSKAKEPREKVNDGMEFEQRQVLSMLRGSQLERGDPSLTEHPSLGKPQRDSSPKNPGAGAHSPCHN